MQTHTHKHTYIHIDARTKQDKRTEKFERKKERKREREKRREEKRRGETLCEWRSLYYVTYCVYGGRVLILKFFLILVVAALARR